MSNLLPKILGWLIVIITLALAPSINTANAAVIAAVVAAGTANTSMIGMSTIEQFGAPLIVISLLFSGTMLGLGKVGDGSVSAMMGVIAAVIGTIVAITLEASVIGYCATLITASATFAKTIYGIIPIVTYVAIIGGAGGYAAYKAFSKK